LLLGYKPVQHFTVLNIVGNFNTTISIIILYYIIVSHYATNRQVASSIPDGVIGIFQ